MKRLIAAMSLAFTLSGGAAAQSAKASGESPMWVGFTLVKADNSGRTDPSLGGLDSTLRSVLRFTGYRGTAAAFSVAHEGGSFDVTMIANANRRTVRVFCTVERVNENVSPATAQLRIRLQSVDSADAKRVLEPPILSAGLTIPEAQKVVVGRGDYDGGGLALVVTWKRGQFGKNP